MSKEWWEGELANDILAVLRKKELTLPQYKASSPQLAVRRYLVDWLAIIFEKIGSSYGILHLSVTLMDYFMDNHDIPEPQLHLVALTCFLLAAKFDEIENRIPTIEQLNFFVHNSFERSEFHAMELLLLDHFSWNVDLPTAASFVDMFLVHSVLDDDSHSGRPLNNCTKARVYVKKYVHYFLEISLQDHKFLSFKPSVVTAAAVAAARSCLHLTPTWKPALVEITGYEYFEVCECVDLMLKAHDADEKAMTSSRAVVQPTATSSSN